MANDIKKKTGGVKMETVSGIKAGAAAVMAFLLTEFGLIGPAAIIMMLAMGADYITGVMAVIVMKKNDPKNPELGLVSRTGVIGIFKKIGYMMGVGVGLGLDWLISLAAQELNMPFTGSTFFGLLVCVWFILNEFVSILENLDRMGSPMPKFLKKLVSLLKKQVDDKADSLIPDTASEEETK